ncbi:adenine nucleotide alpha hydrolases-like protein [Cylindrobasidium torrendii FP15055 ss-10]|uniref:FAD synthase n=1 Tax=Cylindrobasidium torrendii FP15055 ss-10 TaxID=1314674 RepID=A0A0D7AXA2_9AGAR|nr:adenine nucleotide alpha hydrolases-like protein [Cylindrobasidium torrendii FP15055 ss-10]
MGGAVYRVYFGYDHLRHVSNSVMDFKQIAKDVYALAASDDPIAPLLNEAITVIEEALDTHGQDRTSISFNGGKDCTVLLYVYAAILAKRAPTHVGPIHSVYIACPSPFSDLEDFINEAATAYNLDLFRCTPPEEKAKDAMRHGLEIYKARYPDITAILIGTRRTDPHGATLSHRNMTSPGWPQYERINPIINWDYADIWTFLKKFNVPYCCLYDQGYTSLGSTHNTYPNPALLCIAEKDSSPKYSPAFKLKDGNLERCGRGSQPTTAAAPVVSVTNASKE